MARRSILVAGTPGTGSPLVAAMLGRRGLEAAFWEGTGDESHYRQPEFLGSPDRPWLLLLDADAVVSLGRIRPPWSQAELPESAALAVRELDACRQRLFDLRLRCDLLLDTTCLDENTLSGRLGQVMGLAPLGDGADPVVVLESFAFPRGVPLDLHHCLDARALRNPFWESELRMRSGLDPLVQDFVLSQPLAREMLDRIENSIKLLLPELALRTRRSLRVAIGCTGGFHRSVSLTEELSRRLRAEGTAHLVWHRDLPVRA